jgi:hypothetical protein
VTVRVKDWPEAVTAAEEALAEHCEFEIEPLPPMLTGPVNPLISSFARYRLPVDLK